MTLRLGIAGFGAVAEGAHVPAFAKRTDFEVVAVADPSPVRRERARELLPDARTFSDLSEMLARADLDLADVASPPHLHAEQVEEALAAGVHVLCEKPLVLDGATFSRIRRAATTANRALFTVHNWKHAPVFQSLCRALEEGAIGRPLHMTWHTLRTRPASVATADSGNWRTDPARSGGGILVDHGWHAIYLATSVLGPSPSSVSAVLHRPEGAPKGAVEDEASCLLELPLGAAFFHLTWRATRRDHRGLVIGEKGEVEIGDDRIVVSTSGEAPREIVAAERFSAGSAHPGWFLSMLDDLADAVAGGPAREENLLEAEACVRVLEEAYRTGR